MVVGPVTIRGLRRTRESLVRDQVDLQPGEPLDPRRLAALERRLRDLGIFSRAVVTASEETPASITIDLEEDARYGLAYDLRYEEGSGPSALVDGEVRNLFGRGMVLSARVRGGGNIREGRLAFHVPSILRTWIGRAGNLTVGIFRRDERLTIAREIVPGEPTVPTFEDTRFEQGFNLHQTLRLRDPWVLLYGYSGRRANYSSVRFRPVETYDLGSLDTTLIRDNRDNPLNPRRGRFHSFSLEAGHRVLGSDYDFLKGYVQVSINQFLKPTLMWAQGYRLGAMRAAGGVRLPDEVLFRAGGPNSLRGFSAESLAAEDEVNDVALGEAVIIVNQELRYMPLQGRLGGALFYDTGNVFDRVEDISFDFTHTLGVGLRYDSVVGLVRVDLAFPLNKPPGEPSYRLLFGIGQAF
jgi:translocation and assembly module TamA